MLKQNVSRFLTIKWHLQYQRIFSVVILSSIIKQSGPVCVLYVNADINIDMLLLKLVMAKALSLTLTSLLLC